MAIKGTYTEIKDEEALQATGLDYLLSHKIRKQSLEKPSPK